MHYVIGDIHGRYCEFMRLLGKLNLTDDDTVVLVGDVIDRAVTASEQKSIIDWCKANVKSGGKYQMVLGNHEYELKRFIDSDNIKIINNAAFYVDENQDYETDTQYDFFYAAKTAGIDIAELKDFIETLPLYVDFNIDGKDYIITHSWLVDKFERNLVTDDYKEHINEIDVKNSIWDRGWSLTSNDSNVTVIHGHTPTVRRRWSGVRVELAQIRILQNNINIDCGMYNNLCRGGNLAAYCIETGESIYAFNKEDLDMFKLDYTGLREDDFSFKTLSLDESVLNSSTSMTVFNNRVYSLLP